MTAPKPTLCAPDQEKTCFACCPPIRPAGYEHIQYKNMIKRVLRENTKAFDRKSRDFIPIVGFHCWALGYLDSRHKRVGCLLHPALNEGRDLRFRIEYGNKCERESCPEAKRFAQLGFIEQAFWVPLANGLDAFAYSSRERNILFSLMGWGLKLLRLIPQWEEGRVYKATSFMDAYPFFTTSLSPRGHAYLLDRVVSERKQRLLKHEGFRSEFEAFSKTWVTRDWGGFVPVSNAPYTHLLDLDHDFLDFVRLSLHMQRIDKATACQLKTKLDKALEAQF